MPRARSYGEGMTSSSNLVIAGVVIVVLLALLISSFLRHLRWEERLMKWRIRVFFHCLAFLVIVGAGAYIYLGQ